jgi:hypothetical protein
MMKAGLIDEMMNEAIDGALDTEDMEEETEEQIEQVLAEIAGDMMAALPSANKVSSQLCALHPHHPPQPLSSAFHRETSLQGCEKQIEVGPRWLLMLLPHAASQIHFLMCPVLCPLPP